MWISALWSSLQQHFFLPCLWASTLSFAGCFSTQVGNANIPKAICQIQLFSSRKVSVPCLLPLSDRTCANLSSCLSSLFPSSGCCANSDQSSSRNSQTYVAFTGISYWLPLPGNLSLAIGRLGISVRPLPTRTLKLSRRPLIVCLPNREIFNSQLLCTDKKYQCFNTYSHHSSAKGWLLSYVLDYLLSLPPSLEG